MRKVVVSSVFAALLVLTGCSDKEPKVEGLDNAAAGSKVSSAGESVSGKSLSSSESESDIMARLEKEFSSVYFDFDKFNIRADMQANVSKDASVAKSQASKYAIKLEGNCDEWGSDEYNFALGLKRANTVKNALVAEGVDTNRISMVSLGEGNPTCTDKTKECWSKNRRVEFKLLP
ncbi:MAG: OmpA family protein [Campylobacterota bacterium]